MDAPSPLDQTRAASLCRLYGNSFADLVHRFVAELAVEIGVLTTDVHAGRPTEVHTRAHRLVGTVGMFGFVRLEALLRELEVVLPHDPADREAIVQGLRTATREASDALTTFLDEGRAHPGPF